MPTIGNLSSAPIKPLAARNSAPKPDRDKITASPDFAKNYLFLRISSSTQSNEKTGIMLSPTVLTQLEELVHKRIFTYLPVSFGEIGILPNGKALNIAVLSRTLNGMIALGKIAGPSTWPTKDAVALVMASRKTVDLSSHSTVHVLECNKPCLIMTDDNGVPSLVIDGAARIVHAAFCGLAMVSAVFVTEDCVARFLVNAQETGSNYSADTVQNGVLQRIYDVTATRADTDINTLAGRKRKEKALGPLSPPKNEMADGIGYRPGRFSRFVSWIDAGAKSRAKGRKGNDGSQTRVTEAIARTVAELVTARRQLDGHVDRTRYVNRLLGHAEGFSPQEEVIDCLLRLGLESSAIALRFGLGNIGDVRDIVSASFQYASIAAIRDLVPLAANDREDTTHQVVERVGVVRLAALGVFRNALYIQVLAKRQLVRHAKRRSTLQVISKDSKAKEGLPVPLPAFHEALFGRPTPQFDIWAQAPLLLHGAFACGVNPCHIWAILQPHFPAFFWAIQAGALMRKESAVINVFQADAYLAYKALDRAGGLSPYTALWRQVEGFFEIAGVSQTILAQCYLAAKTNTEMPLTADHDFAV
jgi:hypothetical protein